MKRTKDEKFESIIKLLGDFITSEKSRQLRSAILDEHAKRVRIYPVTRPGNLDEVHSATDSTKTKQLEKGHSSELQSDNPRYYHPKKTTISDPVAFRLDYRNNQGEVYQGEWIELEQANRT
ncbi:MAG: hypothetical protein OXI01_24170 [Albidovulum sp.]|nr:hypothetical protein [Albidovulum sp.]